MISKELLSEVLDRKDISDVWINKINKNIIGFYTQHEIENNINIYELAWKCKEWAFKQGWEYILNSHKTINGENYKVWLSESENEWFADTEPEAVFKACEWIKDNL